MLDLWGVLLFTRLSKEIEASMKKKKKSIEPEVLLLFRIIALDITFVSFGQHIQRSLVRQQKFTFSGRLVQVLNLFPETSSTNYRLDGSKNS